MRVAVAGASLRKLRCLHQVTVTDLARAVGMTPSGICHIENGRRDSVKVAVFQALVRELDIVDRPDWLMPPPEVDIPGPRSSTASRLPSSTASGIIEPRKSRESGRTAA